MVHKFASVPYICKEISSPGIVGSYHHALTLTDDKTEIWDHKTFHSVTWHTYTVIISGYIAEWA